MRIGHVLCACNCIGTKELLTKNIYKPIRSTNPYPWSIYFFAASSDWNLLALNNIFFMIVRMIIIYWMKRFLSSATPSLGMFSKLWANSQGITERRREKKNDCRIKEWKEHSNWTSYSWAQAFDVKNVSVQYNKTLIVFALHFNTFYSSQSAKIRNKRWNQRNEDRGRERSEKEKQTR